MKLWRKMANKTFTETGELINGRMYKRMNPVFNFKIVPKLAQALLVRVSTYSYPLSDKQVRREKLKGLFDAFKAEKGD